MWENKVKWVGDVSYQYCCHVSCFMDLTLEMLQLNPTLSCVSLLQLLRCIFGIKLLLGRGVCVCLCMCVYVCVPLCSVLVLSCQHLTLLQYVLHDLCIAVTRSWSDLPYPSLWWKDFFASLPQESALVSWSIGGSSLLLGKTWRVFEESPCVGVSLG